MVVDTVVVVSLLISTEDDGGRWTYVEEESAFTTVQSSCNISFVDVCSVYISALSLPVPPDVCQGMERSKDVPSKVRAT